MVKEYIEKEECMEAKNPFVITMLMFKGGIGKSALSRIVASDLSKKGSVLLNLDISRDIKQYASSDSINYAEILDDEEITVSEYIDHLKEVAEYIIIDTPGEIGNAETMDAIGKTDLFIMPFGVDKEEEDSLITTLQNTILTDDGLYPENKPLSIMFVLNNYKEKDDVEATAPLMERIFHLIEERENQSNEPNIFFSNLKYTKAINTMNKTAKSIQNLSTENRVAYRMAKTRIKDFMAKIKKSIEETKEVLNNEQ